MNRLQYSFHLDIKLSSAINQVSRLVVNNLASLKSIPLRGVKLIVFVLITELIIYLTNKLSPSVLSPPNTKWNQWADQWIDTLIYFCFNTTKVHLCLLTKGRGLVMVLSVRPSVCTYKLCPEHISISPKAQVILGSGVLQNTKTYTSFFLNCSSSPIYMGKFCPKHIATTVSDIDCEL